MAATGQLHGVGLMPSAAPMSGLFSPATGAPVQLSADRTEAQVQGQPDLRQQRTVGTGHRTQGRVERGAQLLIQPQVHRSIRHGALLIKYDQTTRA